MLYNIVKLTQKENHLYVHTYPVFEPRSPPTPQVTTAPR